jgi:hypothetical protein
METISDSSAQSSIVTTFGSFGHDFKEQRSSIKQKPICIDMAMTDQEETKQRTSLDHMLPP